MCEPSTAYSDKQDPMFFVFFGICTNIVGTRAGLPRLGRNTPRVLEGTRAGLPRLVGTRAGLPRLGIDGRVTPYVTGVGKN